MKQNNTTVKSLHRVKLPYFLQLVWFLINYTPHPTISQYLIDKKMFFFYFDRLEGVYNCVVDCKSILQTIAQTRFYAHPQTKSPKI